LAGLTYQRWHEIAAAADINTPCAPPPVPTLDGGDTTGTDSSPTPPRLDGGDSSPPPLPTTG
jgi:hypothetical protein